MAKVEELENVLAEFTGSAAPQPKEVDESFGSDAVEDYIKDSQPPANPPSPLDDVVDNDEKPVSEPIVDDEAPIATDDEAKPQNELDGQEESWESFIDENLDGDDVATPSPEFLEISKSLGLEEPFKTKEELVSYVSELQQKATNQAANQDTSVLPPTLAEAIDIAQKNGDYLTYLEIGSRDYSKEDPIELFEEEITQYFMEKDGTFKEDDYIAYLDSISDVDKAMRGKQLQHELISIQNQQKQVIAQQAEQRRQASLRQLESAMTKFDGIGNSKATPKVKSALLGELSTGKFLDVLGIKPNGQHNWDKVIETYFKARYFDAIQKYNSREVTAKTTREIIDGVTNSSVKREVVPQNVTEPIKKKTGIDLYLDSINR